jgi:hypothetical protein
MMADPEGNGTEESVCGIAAVQPERHSEREHEAPRVAQKGNPVERVPVPEAEPGLHRLDGTGTEQKVSDWPSEEVEAHVVSDCRAIGF